MTSTEPSILPPAADADAGRAMLRHAVATLAYRAGRSLRDAPGGFGAAGCARGARRTMDPGPVWTR